MVGFKDSHRWKKVSGNDYRCTTEGCPATGRTWGSAWPPIRTADYALAETCEKAKRVRLDRQLKALGVDPGEVKE